jgi:hypothetical protein
MLILHTNSGLANRMRVIVSGLSIAVELNIPLKVIWKSDSDLNCGFYDLFEVNKDLKICSNYPKAEIIYKLRNYPTLLRFVCKVFGVGLAFFDKDILQTALKTGSRKLDPDILKTVNGDTYIHTCHDFYFKRENLSYLVPKQSIQEKVSDMTKSFPHLTIGIHIRRTDNLDSIQMSPIELFCSKIEEEIYLNKDVCFYLATDDPEVKKYLLNKYASKIITADIVHSRNSKQGIYGAMIDLYCLAKTQKIYGSFWSSFSEIASFLGNIPLTIVKK